jgi:pimeloyl-ACP methyl ester carboxylesterase
VRDFRWLGAALEPKARLVRLDMPGFGGTPRSTLEGVTVAERARFVLEVLEALGLEGVTLVGHSMGGAVVLDAASRADRRVRALALLSSIGVREHRALRLLPGRGGLGRALEHPVSGTLLRPLTRQVMKRAGFPPTTPWHEVVHTARLVSGLSFEALAQPLRELKVPTLLAWARDDRLIEEEIFLELAPLLPAGPRLSWDEGGHNVQKTHAVELAEAIATLARG